MRTVSWVILALVGLAILLGGSASAFLAYRGDPGNDEFGPGGATVKDVAAWRGDVATAIRARRGTAAAFASAFAVLFLFVVVGPYRRGDAWSWWALLTAMLVLAALLLARVPLLGTRLGAATGAYVFGAAVVGLLLDVGRLRSRPAAS